MITRYLTLKYVDPIEVKIEDELSLFNLLAVYIEQYGECFIGLMDTYEDAIQEQVVHYLEFGDIELCQDLITLDYLENCYNLEVNK